METPKIKKVSVEGLLSLMNFLYHRGVDYVDLHLKEDLDEEDKDTTQDTLGVTFGREYMSESLRDMYDAIMEEIEAGAAPVDTTDIEDEPIQEEPTNEKLSDEDLNQLI